MSEDWFAAWAIATVVALFATPLLARRGTPRPRRRASLATAAAPLLSVSAALPFAIPDLDVELAVVLLGAVWLWWAGQMLERGLLPPVVRRFATGLAASAAVAAGLRVELVGVAWLDAALTVLLIWGATSGFRSAETRDGLLLGWAAAIAAGAGLLGGLGSQPAVAVLGAAVVGASLGFLPFVIPPVAARLRRGGASFIGFLAVALAVAADPSAPDLSASTAHILLVIVPLIEGALGTAARRRGRTNDPRVLGLVGRWRALGLPRLAVTLGLVTLQAGLAVVAVLIGRGVIDLLAGGVVALVALALFVLPAMLIRIDARPGRWPRWAFVSGLAVMAAAVLLAIPASLALLRARTDTSDGAKAAQRALAATRRGDAEAADEAFREAEVHFAAAQDKLDGVEVQLGATVPVLGPNVDAARELVDVGADLARLGRNLTSTADEDRLRIVDATVNLGELARLRPELITTARLLTTAQQRIDDIDRTFLIPPIEDAVDELHRRIDRAARDSRTAAISSRILPSILGGDGSRRYLVAMQNNAEARATGGFIGDYAELTAVKGKLELGEIEPIRTLNPLEGDARTLEAPEEYVLRYSRFSPERVWQNVNASPDVPTVAAVEASLLAQGPFGPVDGVVTIDPIGLAAILRITGPITVPGWPEQITAENVVDTTLHDAYIYFEDDNERREAFLGDVVDVAWDEFSNRDLGSPARVVKELARATRTKHLTLWFADPKAQALAVRAGADGAVPRDPTDLVLVTTGNAAQNKIDYFHQRGLNYDLELFPRDDVEEIAARGNLTVTLQNNAPATGLPNYIIGSNRPDYAAGENGTFFSAYSTLDRGTATIDGEASDFEHQREFGRHVYSRFVRIPAETTKTIDLELAGELRLGPEGWYELALSTQPSVRPDRAEVRLRLPDGWRFADPVGGLEVSDDARQATFEGRLDRDRLLGVRVLPDHGDGIWGKIQDGKPL